jgi:hypothetical protein
MSTNVMHVGSYSPNNANPPTSVRLKYDALHYPGDLLHQVTVTSDSTIHGALDIHDPTDLKAIVYVPAATFTSLLADLVAGKQVTVTVTCDAQNNVTNFTYVAALVVQIQTLIANTSAGVEALQAAIPADLKQQLATLHADVTDIKQLLSASLLPSGVVLSTGAEDGNGHVRAKQ